MRRHLEIEHEIARLEAFCARGARAPVRHAPMPRGRNTAAHLAFGAVERLLLPVAALALAWIVMSATPQEVGAETPAALPAPEPVAISVLPG